jgi:hypothetical protein
VRFGKPAILLSCDAGKEARCVKESIEFIRDVIRENKHLVVVEKIEDKEELKTSTEHAVAEKSSVSDMLMNELQGLRSSDAACDSDANSGIQVMGFWAQARRTGFAIIQM